MTTCDKRVLFYFLIKKKMKKLNIIIKVKMNTTGKDLNKPDKSLDEIVKNFRMETTEKDLEKDLEKMVMNFRMDKSEIKNLCINEKNLLKQCILCKNYLSAQQWSGIMENRIKEIFDIKQKINSTSGDGIINKNNIEIKASLGDIKGTFNFVQLRPGHSIKYYIFLTYDAYESTLGKIYWFLISSIDLYKLLPLYGGYAHGTIEKNGRITLENISKECEYSLRPNPIKKDKSKKLWDELLKYNKTEDEIKMILECPNNS